MVPELCTKWAERASVLRRHLTFLVMDKDVLSADDSMGAAVLCLSEAAAKGGAASYRHTFGCIAQYDGAESRACGCGRNKRLVRYGQRDTPYLRLAAGPADAAYRLG